MFTRCWDRFSSDLNKSILTLIATRIDKQTHWHLHVCNISKRKISDMRISNWTLLRKSLLTEHENKLWLQLNTLFSCTSLDAWMITSTAARIELLVCKANARSFICAHCVQSVDLQVCFPTSRTNLPNDLSPEGPAAKGVAHRIKIRRAVLATAAGRVGEELSNYLYIFCSACGFSHQLQH